MAAIALLAGMVLAIGFANRNSAPVGSDDQAEGAIKMLRPAYRPIAKSLWTPGPVAETVLFGVQGATGVAILAWAIYSLRKAHRQTGERVKRHLHLHPHLNDIAFTNHWRHRNPWEKVLFGGGFLAVALLIPPMPGAILVTVIVSLGAIAGARIPVASWLTVLSVPVSFAILTAVGILVQIGGAGPGFAVSVDWNSLPLAIGLLLRSTAAISCLAFIGWTTPLMELIPVFGRIGIPNVLIDLALMIYHFLFVTATTLKEMRRAQSWRLGRADYRSRMRALSTLASGLFIRCIERFRRLENGIDSRGYEGKLWVLSPEHSASFAFIGGTLALQAGLLASGLILWKGIL
jgi:cobalt/nickel transport system permease protein